MSSMPASTEALRTKFEVLTNLWLLAQCRQPGRKMFADFTENERPSERRQFRTPRRRPGSLPGHIGSEYECQLKKEALRSCSEESYPIQEVLGSACADPQNRMKHWIQLLAVVNSRSVSSDADTKTVATLERQVAASATTKGNQGRRQRCEEPRWTTRFL